MQKVYIMQNKIANLLQNKSVVFASINYTTQVKTAAANKHLTVKKTTIANVQLFSNIKAATNVFANAVQKNANVASFKTSSNYFTHTNVYSIVQHKKNSKLYLYAIFNNVSSSIYTINNVTATKQQVAQLLTASAAKQLLSNSNTTYNVKNDITHNIVVRTIALSNINSITTNKQTIS